jgi:hypothetical protein
VLILARRRRNRNRNRNRKPDYEDEDDDEEEDEKREAGGNGGRIDPTELDTFWGALGPTQHVLVRPHGIRHLHWP